MIRSTYTLSSDTQDLIPSDVISQMVKEGFIQSAETQAKDIYTILNIFRDKISDYNQEFNNSVTTFMQKNSVMRKMKQSLNPNTKELSKQIHLQTKDFLKNKSATNQLINTMKKGHDLLLNIRHFLTGQTITTKFLIKYQGHFYAINESELQPKMTLSRFGGNTVSNPFSLAYELNDDILKNIIQQQDNENQYLADEMIWNMIYNLKKPYLRWKTSQTHREYKNIFYDSKDAEIYELVQQLQKPLTLQDYISLRSSLGGGGGYASPFYKIGDINSTQIKYFNIKENGKSSFANFARFSLLRDRLRELENILNSNDINTIKNNLITFFTEKETNIDNALSYSFNEQAKKILNSLFKNT